MAEIIMPVNGSSPSTPSLGLVTIYPKADNKLYVKDSTGVEVKLLTSEETLNSIAVTLPLTVTSGNNPVIAINPATTINAGTMSASDKTRLDAATPNKVVNTIVMRDISNNINADVIGTSTTCSHIPSLSGHISSNGTNNVTTINPNSIVNTMISDTAAITLAKLAVNPLDRQLHTGTQLANTISNLSATIFSTITDNITNAHISSTAAIANSKLATNPLERTNHTGTQLASTISDLNASVLTYLNTGIITNASISNTAAIANSKLATNPLDRNNHTGVQFSNTISDFSTAVANSIVDGAGLLKSGNTFNVVGTPSRISVSPDSIDISSSYIGQSSISVLGEVVEGEWNASPIDISYGGTNATTSAKAGINLRTINTISSSSTLTLEQEYLFVTTTSNVTLTLPLATNATKVRYIIKKVSADSNTITITRAGSDTIDGTNTKVLTTQYETITIISDGNSWLVV